jgi:hypothetical protein
VDRELAVTSLVLSGLALLVAIASVLYTRRQARADEEMLAFERVRHEEELRRLQQEQERAQASRVFASAYGRSGQEYLVHIENRSDAPIRELYAVVEPQHPGESVSQGRRVLGMLSAGESAKPGAPARGEPADDATRVSVELVFTDVEGRSWRRQGPTLERGEVVEKQPGITRWRPLR